jgi:hypothetical protein
MNVPALVLVLLEGVLGAAAHLPALVTFVGAVAIGCYLALFAVRERARSRAQY